MKQVERSELQNLVTMMPAEASWMKCSELNIDKKFAEKGKLPCWTQGVFTSEIVRCFMKERLTSYLDSLSFPGNAATVYTGIPPAQIHATGKIPLHATTCLKSSH